jgi:hypothetical protein
MRKLLIVLGLILLLVGGLVASLFFVPWNNLLEGRLVAALQAQGVQHVSLQVDKVTFNHAILKNIRIGEGENPLVLDTLTLNYAPRELLAGRLQDVSLSGVHLAALQSEDGWTLTGWNAYTPHGADPAKPFDLTRLIDALPFDKVKMTESSLSVHGASVQTVVPFTLDLQKGDQATFVITTMPTTLQASSTIFALGEGSLKAAPNESGWAGEWNLSSLALDKDSPIPELKGKGSLTLAGEDLKLAGTFNSHDKTHTGSFTYAANIKDMGAASLVVTKASFPFKEGLITTRNVNIPLAGKDSFRINLNIQQVSADALMQALTGKRVTATGTLSGTVPVIISRNGTYTFGAGALSANGEGLIQMPPDAIPGNNEQVALVRDILENLHYKVLSAAIDNQGGGRKIAVKLSLEGNNPDIMDGRPVKLNVNLTGDILDFIQQNVMLFSNPEKLLEQNK